MLRRFKLNVLWVDTGVYSLCPSSVVRPLVAEILGFSFTLEAVLGQTMNNVAVDIYLAVLEVKIWGQSLRPLNILRTIKILVEW